MNIIKRDGRQEQYEEQKIIEAIEKAMKYGSGIVEKDIAKQVAKEITGIARELGTITIFQVEDLVFNKLVEKGQKQTAKAYEGYRAVQEFKREENTTDDSILGLLELTNSEVLSENSNKNGTIISTQRDLIAGEVSKDIARRKLIPPHLIQAHEEGQIHIHDLDYLMQPMFNCCLINLEDMLNNGTIINEKMVETPKSFQVACTVATQIVAQVASNQFGGQSLANIDTILAPYARKSYNKYYKKHYERLHSTMQNDRSEAYIKTFAEKYADEDMRKEIRDGVQTIQYQINTLMTTNGQAPFLTLSLHFEEDYKYAYEASIIQEEILKQRLQGIKNKDGVWVTPAFPKLIYILDEHNIHRDSKYYYITELAAKCTAKRMYPDYISAKHMRKNYEGNIVTPMGCRSFLAPFKDEQGEYKFDGRFNIGVQTINLPNIALTAKGDIELFYKILEDRLELIKEMGLVRYNLLKDVTSDVSPIHWQHGAIARMEQGEKIGKLLKGGYSTVSIGYIGLYETVKLLTGETHTTKEGQKTALDILDKLNNAKDKWREETGLGWAVYGTPSENTAGRLCNLDKETFGEIEDITDKGYYVNSYHVDVREEIDAFSKLKFEAPFQEKSIGGAISYIEIPNMNHNTEAILEVMKYMYDNILYAEFNTKSDYCYECGFDGEIIINDDLEWECPQCHNKNKEKMDVVRRVCGYLGENFFSEGRTKDIKDRVLHL